MTAQQHETREWRSQAACRDVDAELFFPVAESGPARAAQVVAAKAVCTRCPVRVECLDEALTRVPYGIAGGMTERERRKLCRSHGTTDPESTPEVADVLLTGRTHEMTTRQRAGAGRALLAAGRSPREVAHLCGVTIRTAERWATRTRTTPTQSVDVPGGTGEGSDGGNRAPIQISTAQQPCQAAQHRKESEGR